ncbi:MAG: hypothetical protein JWQ19_1383 [Subtercola sp.]|nr:hypothetical protein [Subtercola sp.]
MSMQMMQRALNLPEQLWARRTQQEHRVWPNQLNQPNQKRPNLTHRELPTLRQQAQGCPFEPPACRPVGLESEQTSHPNGRGSAHRWGCGRGRSSNQMRMSPESQGRGGCPGARRWRQRRYPMRSLMRRTGRLPTAGLPFVCRRHHWLLQRRSRPEVLL